MAALINLIIGVFFISLVLYMNGGNVKSYLSTPFNIFYVLWVIVSTVALSLI